MKIYIGKTGSFTDVTDNYDRNSGGLSVATSFDNTVLTSTATFMLVDPEFIPKPAQMVEIYFGSLPPKTSAPYGYNGGLASNDLLLFSGVIKSVVKTVKAKHNLDAYKNVAAYNVSAESWEVSSSNFKMILYEEFYSEYSGNIIRKIIGKYMPHLTCGTSIAVDSGIVLEKCVFVNRKPQEAITAVCALTGDYWYVLPNRVLSIAKIYGSTDVSPLTISDSSAQIKHIELTVTDSTDDAVNDLFLQASNVRDYPVRETFSTNGWDGKYNLKTTPYGLEKVLMLVDEFNGDEDSPVDAANWSLQDGNGYEQGDIHFTPAMNLDAGRLSMFLETVPNILVSRQLFNTNSYLSFRNLEVEFVNIPSGSFYAMGVHTGNPGIALSNILFGALIRRKSSTQAELTVLISGVEHTLTVPYILDFASTDPKPYQIRIIVERGGNVSFDQNSYVCKLLLQKPDELDTAKYVNAYEAVLTLPDYLAFCPAYTYGGLDGSVIQASVSSEPVFSVWVQDIGFINTIYGLPIDGGSRGSTQDAGADYHTWIDCGPVNWQKHNLTGLGVQLLASDGTVYPGTQSYFTIAENTKNAFRLQDDTHTYTTNWIKSRNILKFKLYWRKLSVGMAETNDYNTHCYIEQAESVSRLAFYAEEIPAGFVTVNYYASSTASMEIYNQTDIDRLAAITGIPSDDGTRRSYQQAPEMIHTMTELAEYGRTFLTSQGYGFIQGSVQTDTNLLGSHIRLRPGMKQPVALHIGREDALAANTYISSVNLSDAGGGVLTASVELGNVTGFIRQLFLNKLAELHKDSMFIDDRNQQRPYYDDRRNVTNIYRNECVTAGTGYFTKDLRLYLIEPESSVSKTEIRLDDKPGNDSGCLDSVTWPIGSPGDFHERLLIATSAIRKRNYTVYVYDQASDGTWSNPAVITMHNPSPVPYIPSNSPQITDDGRITVVLNRPMEADVVKRKIYVNNTAVQTKDLPYSDLILEILGNQTSAEFLAYDSIQYITLQEIDELNDNCSYLKTNEELLRYDRVFNTGMIAKPPASPIVINVQNANNDSTIPADTLRIKVRPGAATEDLICGKPSIFHMQFCASLPFPDPVLKDSGTGAIITSALASQVTLPGINHSGIAAGDLILLQVKTTINGVEKVYGWQGREIAEKIVTVTETILKINGNFLIDKSDAYVWKVWDKWYENSTLTGYINLDVNQSGKYNMLEDTYEFLVPNVKFSGYIRTYASNSWGLSEPSVYGSIVNSCPIPDPPSSIQAYLSGGGKIKVSWSAPEAGQLVKGYKIRVSPFDYEDYGAGLVRLNYYTEAIVSGAVLSGEVIVTSPGSYAIGVCSYNDGGESAMTVYNEEN